MEGEAETWSWLKLGQKWKPEDPWNEKTNYCIPELDRV